MQKVVVKLMGGLGNQMFQYAAGKKISDALNCPLSFDTNFLEDRTTGVVYRNYDLDIFSKIDHQISNLPNQEIGKIVLNDSNIDSFSFDIVDKNSSIYLDGFFQKHHHVSHNMHDIFFFEKFENEKCYSLLQEINSCESLMVNVRRADYVSRPSALSFHGFLENKYIDCALKKLNKNFDNIFLFSDEPEWCKENIKLSNLKVVDHSYAGSKFKDYLFLMSQFDNMIIPNSTFAWWAAWMAEKRNKNTKIVAPGTTLWFASDHNKSKGLIPNTWQRLEKKEL